MNNSVILSCLSTLTDSIAFFVDLDDYIQFCTSMVAARNVLTSIFENTSLGLLIILILVSIFGHIKENYKWFVIHAALCNCVIIIYIDAISFTSPLFQSSYTKSLINTVLNNLSKLSTLPLIFNRFCFLYFPKSYDKLFSPHGVVIFTLGFDILITALSIALKIISNLIFIRIFGTFFVVLIVLLSVLTYAKIYRMRKLATNDSSIKSIKRASLVCYFQAFLYFSYYLWSFSSYFLNTIFSSPTSTPLFWAKISLIINRFEWVVYEIAIVADSVMLLIVLKSYRQAIRHALNSILKKFSYQNGNFNMSSTTVNRGGGGITLIVRGRRTNSIRTGQLSRVYP
jgi:hypothetical protein